MFAEHAKVAGQLDIAGDPGQIAHHIMARGRHERVAEGEIQFDVFAQLIDRAAPLVRNLVQGISGGVFEKNVIRGRKSRRDRRDSAGFRSDRDSRMSLSAS